MKTQHARLAINIEWEGDAQEADIRECLLSAAAHLSEEGLLTPAHDCKLVDWSAEVITS